MAEFLAGTISASLLVIALFFLRFWKRTRDRLFLYFGAAFVTLMIEQILRSVLAVNDDSVPAVYSVRLVAFAFIIFGIAGKNRRS